MSTLERTTELSSTVESLPSVQEAVGGTDRIRLPELLAPAGDWDCVRAAIEAGADAIYFGLTKLNARMRARNFTVEELPELMQTLHRRGLRGYVTINTLVFTEELSEAEALIRACIEAHVDGVIVQDVGLARLIRAISPDFPIHASTQMTITSTTGARMAWELGCRRVILARELSIEDIARIRRELDAVGCPIQLEVFVHGALCVAYSGQCLTSESLGGRSANRGECAQACRLPYQLVVDGKTVPLGPVRYLLSPRDLALWSQIPDLIRAGVQALKIEGRLKPAAYVAATVRAYREALDRVRVDPEIRLPSLEDPSVEPLRYRLEMAFSRGLGSGWLLGTDHRTLVHGR